MVTMVRTSTRPLTQSSDARSSQQLLALQTAERQWSYALLRLLLGVDLFGHGFIRIHNGTATFATSLVAQMSAAPLSPSFVHAFGLAVPWIELVIGTLLVLGLLTRTTLIATMLFMTVLMAGVTLKQDWPAAGLQLIYGFVIFALLFLRRPYNASWLSLFGFNTSLPTDDGPRP